MSRVTSRFASIPLWVRGILGLLALVLLLVIGYVIYYFASYYRIEDNLTLEVRGAAGAPAEPLAAGQE